jgi:hypothetical protein
VSALFMCMGVLADDGNVRGRYGLLRELAENDGVGAIVGTPDIALFDENDLADYAALAFRGEDVGASLRAFGDERAGRSGRARLLLFGDPSVALASQGGAPFALDRRIESGAVDRNAEFLSALVEGEEADSDFGWLPKAAVASQLLGRLRYRAVLGHESDPRFVDAVGRSVLEVVTARGLTPSSCWTGYAGKVTEEGVRIACFACGAGLRCLRVELRLPGGPQRWIALCQRCGVVVDTDDPGMMNARLGFDGQALVPHWPSTPRVVALVMEDRSRRRRVLPVGGERGRFPMVAFEGRVACYALWGTNLTVLQRRVP